jgi:hypothetical protein
MRSHCISHVLVQAINEKRGKAATSMVDGNDATQINEIAAALLCTALSNLTVGPRALRQASYDLLMASEPYVTSGRTRVVRCGEHLTELWRNELLIRDAAASHLPSNLTMIAVEVMEQSASAKHLTVPFINAWCEAFLAASQIQRPFLARSLPPWIKNLIAMQKDDDNIVLSCLKSLIGLQSLGSVVSHPVSSSSERQSLTTTRTSRSAYCLSRMSGSSSPTAMTSQCQSSQLT